VSTVTLPTGGPSLLDGYREFVGDETISRLEALARRLSGRRVVMVNSTAVGGGVAEILHRMVRLLEELGVPTTWEVMPGDTKFYAITKAIHNSLHGAADPITSDDWDYFQEMNRRAADQLALDADIVMIHDPQPVALASLRRRPGQVWVWRCHIDLSAARTETWDAIEPSMGFYDAAVFSHHTFVPRLPMPSYLVPPSIDPTSDKNRALPVTEERDLLAPFGLPARTPWVTQISRFDRLKDPLGVIEAFLLVHKRESAHLILAGGSASDDPEGARVLEDVRARASGHKAISILELPPDSHRIINALQRRSSVVVQKSLREGFALTVSEALWKQRAVVASAVGGIPLQVIHERTGLLVRSIEGCAFQITRLLHSSGLSARLGRAGREHVREHFLHTREARDYLGVFVRMLERASR
jgi:trehalose synthase